MCIWGIEMIEVVLKFIFASLIGALIALISHYLGHKKAYERITKDFSDLEKNINEKIEHNENLLTEINLIQAKFTSRKRGY